MSVAANLSGSSRQLGRWGSLKDRRIGSQADIQNGTLQRHDYMRNSTTDADSGISLSFLLYYPLHFF